MKLVCAIVLSFVVFASPVSSGEKNSFNRERTFDVTHYLIRLKFDKREKSVAGDTVITLKPLGAPISSVELDAFRLSIESVTLSPGGKELGHSSSGHKLKIVLDRKYSPEETISIRFRYTANPKKGIYFVNERKQKGVRVHSAQIWTQGESEETHHWLPSFDFPDDKATTEQFLTVEKGETAIANGEFVDKKENPDGTVTFHYHMPLPHSVYLTSFVIGEYEKVSDTYRKVPLGFYVYPGKSSIVPLAFGKTKLMFRVFEDLTGIPYPYNKYDQILVANFQFGGMENITATTMSDTEIGFARFQFGKQMVEDLVSHELAHSWFGNLVTCRNWAELWLNEGFATLMEAVFRERTYGRANYILKIKQDAAEYMAYESSESAKRHGLFNTLADPFDDDSMFDAITYQKGGAVLHTLREELGDETFWKGVRYYLKEHSFKNVETKDLRNAMERVSGRDLGWFFRQWMYQTGYPKLRVRQRYDRRKRTLTLDLQQTQTVRKTAPEAFILPLEVLIKTRTGERLEKISLKDRQQTVVFRDLARPQKVTFDPNLKIPLKTVKIVRPRRGR